uniref:Uncharacterized protein n=1 Tax=Strombidium inclinatum TaxID=197538 RepID=A0A7S3IFV7_9SPIT|mmetsp:Transcript_16440/g.25391  ORF Transcript_16440/g.25391 Transcript_16440/m.25391 type:complete len:237 (+) Transcript_16440:403-1113(+)|eukprot:CAMPEP_0170489132 /NCGR_PEP_ID=MMETSP0208-20121228/7522_1 /TAXON_ID=197538 /ORGANISM="Strombidium inclinatum, Strain S3" /LENGTH=236 /DNA_ID=CAMNT_0010763921 /DNA_START=401 /DNA_END=1111 /DNA_ORIENTATION=-
MIELEEEKKKYDDISIENQRKAEAMKEKVASRKTVWDYVEQFESMINIFAIGIPWAIIGAVLMGGNVVFNVVGNRWWAGGNILLIYNTLYGFSHYLLSILLVMEIDVWIKYAKFIRLLVLVQAAIHASIYLFFLVRFLFLTFLTVSNTKDDLVTLTEDMFLGYNLLVGLPPLLIDVVIIIKEVSMEFFQFLRDDAGANTDDVSLGFHDWWLLFDAILDLVNPWYWFKKDKDPIPYE